MKKILLAFILLTGMSTSLSAGNFEEAKKACASGDAASCSDLGLMYQDARGIKQDEFKAVKFYRKGCDGGSAHGCTNLGMMYQDGYGVRQDEFKAVTTEDVICLELNIVLGKESSRIMLKH